MHDVVIAGAGPVGLFLATELGLAGRSVLVLERDPEPTSPWKAMPLGMRGLSAASVETFYRRGMLRRLLAASGIDEDPETAEDRPARRGGHFAGIMLDPAVVDPSGWPFRLPTPAREGILTSLEGLEAMLSERAAELGVEIIRGAAVTGVTQTGDTVVIQAGGNEYEARWLVGCDGGRSTVRGVAGFDFAGTEPQFTGYLALATIAEPEKLRPGFNLTPHGMYLRTPFPGHLGLMDFDGGAYDRSQTPSRDHLQEVVRRISGTDVTLTEVQYATTFTDRARQATTYRQGRVLLAGDAAHIHSPLGGQGLNTGLGDAVNLGWKLATVLRGQAPEALLDTYTNERHPVAASVLDWSRAQVAAMRPDPHSQAVQAVIRSLIATPDATTAVVDRLSGLAIRYDLGSEEPLTGRNAPDFHLSGGTRLGELLRDGQGVLLDFSPGQALRPVAKTWDGRIRYVAGPARDDLGFGAVLVRPDGVVAWAGKPEPDRFAPAAAQWFGQE